MLQTIHEKLKGPFAISILGVLAVVFVFWGVEFVSLGSGPNASGIKVNGTDLNGEELRRAYQEEINRIQVALGDQDVPAEIRTRIQGDVLEGSIRRELIRQRAEELRLRASDADLLESLKQYEAFMVDGKFNKDAYYATLRAENIEPTRFEAQQRQQLAIRLLDRGLAASTFVTKGELERAAALRNETRAIGYAVVPAASFVAGITPDEASVNAWYEKNAKQYMTAETATIEYIDLSLADVASGVTVTDEALHAYFDENQQRFAAAERRRASHILIAIDKDEAKAKKQAEDLLARAKAGEDFAALARQFSQDTGSAAQGGDLGWAEKSFFVGPFGDAVWGMQQGQIIGPVRTEFGFHVIRLDGVEAGHAKSFDEARVELEGEYRRNEAEKRFGDLQEQLDTTTFESGGNLAQVATKLALTIKKLDVFTRQGGGDLGADPKLVSTVFAADMLGGSIARTVPLGEGRVVAVRVAAHQPSQQRPLAEVRDQVVEAVRLAQAREQASAAASELMKQLQGGGNWSELAAARGIVTPAGPSVTPRAVRRDDATIPAPVLKSAFKASRPQNGPVYGLAALENGDAVVWAVTTAQPGSPESMIPAERQQFVERVRDDLRVGDTSVYVAQLRAEAKVKGNTKIFD